MFFIQTNPVFRRNRTAKRNNQSINHVVYSLLIGRGQRVATDHQMQITIPHVPKHKTVRVFECFIKVLL